MGKVLRFIVASILVMQFGCKRERVDKTYVQHFDTATQSVVFKPFVPCEPDEIVENNSNIEGYSDQMTYSPGDAVRFYIHSKSPEYRLLLYRIGPDKELIVDESFSDGIIQNFKCYAYSHGCDWKKSAEIKIPPSAKSGMYSAQVFNKYGSFWITFVVKPRAAENELAVLASTNTWQAYNDWGGGSFYRHRIQEDVEHSENVSFRRPDPYQDPTRKYGHLAGAETILLGWLEKEGIGYDMYSDRDLHDSPEFLQDYKAVVIQVHPEYYSWEMYSKLREYVDQGGNLLYLGGNGIYLKVVIDTKREILEVRKSGVLHTFQNTTGGKWRDLGYPESSFLGVEYTQTGYGTDAPYKVQEFEHWVFEGTGLKKGDYFGNQCILDKGASGHETDKPSSYTPGETVLLAKGENPEDGGAHMVYYKNKNGGQVFSAASITFTSCLDTDPHIEKITKNVLEEFLK